jgi:hypothetical protein
MPISSSIISYLLDIPLSSSIHLIYTAIALSSVKLCLTGSLFLQLPSDSSMSSKPFTYMFMVLLFLFLCFHFINSTGRTIHLCVCKKCIYIETNGTLYAAMITYPNLTHKFVQHRFTQCAILEEPNPCT